MKIFLIILFLLIAYPLYSQETTGFIPINIDETTINSIDFQIGVEFLRYEKAEPSTMTLSQSTTTNFVGYFDVYQEYQQIQGGIKGFLPLSIGKGTEESDSYGVSNYQTDKLSYERSEIDLYMGYSFKEDYFTIPAIWYSGIRRSKTVQHRSDFSIIGIPQSGRTTETVQSYGLFIGYKGEFPAIHTRKTEWSEELTPVLLLNWCIEYNKPLSNRVTNSAMPDALFKDRIGYTIKIEGGLSYNISSVLSATFNTYGGRTYWQGSSLENFGAGPVKWPENKTDFLGINLGLLFLF